MSVHDETGNETGTETGNDDYVYPDGYREYLDGDVVDVSALGVVLAAREPPMSEEVLNRLRSIGLTITNDEVNLGDLTRWSMNCTVAFPDDPTTSEWRFEVTETPEHITTRRGSSNDDAINATGLWTLMIETHYWGDVQTQYHRHIRVASTFHEAEVIFDPIAESTFTPQRAREIAGWPAPPDSRTMFAIHAVHENDRVWLHTHGLRRFGLLEIEAVEIPIAHAHAYGALVNAVAKRFIEDGIPMAGETLFAGYSMELAWFPWEHCVATLELDGPGGLNDREHHGEPAAMLVAIDDEGDYAVLEAIDAVLTDNPVFFLPRSETLRMAALARHQLPIFETLLAQHGTDDSWAFRLKIGCAVDDPADEEQREREHLWFEVHSIYEGVADVTLRSQPYRIESMNSGMRLRLPMRDLSDFLVGGPDGSAGPESITEVFANYL